MNGRFVADSFDDLFSDRQYILSFYLWGTLVLGALAGFLAALGTKPSIVAAVVVGLIVPFHFLLHAILKPSKQLVKGRQLYLYRTIALASVVCAFALLYIYQRFSLVDLQFELVNLKAQEDDLRAIVSERRLEVAALRSPRVIDVIARRELALVNPGDLLIILSDKSALPTVMRGPIKKVRKSELSNVKPGDFVLVVADDNLSTNRSKPSQSQQNP